LIFIFIFCSQNIINLFLFSKIIILLDEEVKSEMHCLVFGLIFFKELILRASTGLVVAVFFVFAGVFFLLCFYVLLGLYVYWNFIII
jgi:hypothetical protein